VNLRPYLSRSACSGQATASFVWSTLPHRFRKAHSYAETRSLKLPLRSKSLRLTPSPSSQPTHAGWTRTAL
jgi:hypothetical protein